MESLLIRHSWMSSRRFNIIPAMASAIFSSKIIFTIWIIQIFFIIANGELSDQDKNLTHHTSSWKTGRTKRSLADEMPETLRIRIQLEHGKKITLIWKQESQFLANENLPVVAPLSDSLSNVMDDVGRFIIYYDRSRCSAVVYFEKINAFYGVIGTDYYISSIPFMFDQNGNYQLEIIGEPYVTRGVHRFNHIHPTLDPPAPSDVDAWKDFLRIDDDLKQNLKRSASCDVAPSKLQRPEVHNKLRNLIVEKNYRVRTHTNKNRNSKNHGIEFIQPKYYLEILVFVTREIIEYFKQYFEVNHLGWIVRYIITYFNAVELTFRKFKSVKDLMTINIAKIVFEDELMPFEFMAESEVQFTEIVDKLPQYLQDNRPYYLQDSFDHVFIFTGRTIMNGDIQVDALTKYGEDLYEARKENRFYDVVPITVMKFRDQFENYVRAVHEISRTLNLKIESKENGLTSMGQCYGIMQRDGPKCDNCLIWNDDSEEQFKLFFRENRNRCFLLNEPRSLRRPGRSRFLTPYRQCQCFGFDDYKPTPSGFPKKRVTEGGCREPLQCLKRTPTLEYESLTVRPFDGTLCTQNKVCWGGACQLLPPSAYDM